MNDTNQIYCLYISDLHVNKKKKIRQLLKRKKVDYDEIDFWIKKQIQQLAQTIPVGDPNQMRIFIIGDVSDQFYFFQRFFIFYQQLIKIKTYFILGNHELRALFYEQGFNWQQTVDYYRDFLAPLKIELLENDLIVEHNHTIKKYSIETLMSLSDLEIQKILQPNSLNIIAAFHGFKILEPVHRRLKKIVPQVKLIFITHVPYKAWLKDEINLNWIYMYGHSHHNVKTQNCYADNQISNNRQFLKFKFFTFDL